MFLVKNTSAGALKQFEKFDEAALKRYMKINSKEIDNSINFEQEDNEDEDHIDEALKSTADLRQKFGKMIREFMKHTELVPHDELKEHLGHMNAAKDHNKQIKKQEVKEYLQK